MAKVFFTPNSARLFQKIRDQKIQGKIREGMVKLSQNPNAGKKLTGELKGQYSLRIWPYRIIYYLGPKKDVIITDIGHRKEIYR